MRKAIFFILFSFSSIFLSFGKVYAYPNFIGHGYNSCITCHYNPFGNGPINDYGRGVSATAISSRGFYSDNKPEDLISQESGFFFKQPTNSKLRPFASYRGLFLKRNLGEISETNEYINMQADINLVAKFGEAEKLISSISFGYAPVPRALQNSPSSKNMKEYRTREHYIGYRPSPNWGFYAGLMDKPFGIRLVEHTSYSRSTPQLTMDDQSHGAIIHYNNPKIEGGFNFFVGNLVQEEDLRLKGYSGIFEYTLLEKNRIGLSLLSQTNKYLDINAYAAHIRSGLDHGNSLMFELGRVQKRARLIENEKREYYGMFQNHIRVQRGIYLLSSIEYYKNDIDKSYRVRFGPSVQYFPMSKVELRVDLNNTRNFNQKLSTKDRWDLMAQIHLWL